MTSTLELKPVPFSERIEVVDALRGFALLGIIIANIPHTGSFGPVHPGREWAVGTPGIDYILDVFFHVFIDKKFITLFSLLFGFGFYIQWRKSVAGQINFNTYFFFRMFLLLLIGCIHAYLIWFGDILRAYAVCGMFLPLVAGQTRKSLLRTGIVFTVFVTGIIFILEDVIVLLSTYSYDPAVVNQLEYAGTYQEYLKINFTIDPFVNFFQDSLITLSFAFGCMLLGFYLGKLELFNKPLEHKRLLNRWIWIGGTLGVGASVTFWLINTGVLELSLPTAWLVFLIIGGMVLQSLAYTGLFIKLFSSKAIRPWLRFFIPVGRMALTNYVLQSVFYVTLFFHFFPGPHLYGKLTLTETYLLAVLLFLLQSRLSQYWLLHFSQGPLEYLWRRLSYSVVRK